MSCHRLRFLLQGAELLVYLDVVVLLAALSVSSYLAIKKRRRRDIFILMIFLSALFLVSIEKAVYAPLEPFRIFHWAFFDTTYTMPVAGNGFFSAAVGLCSFFWQGLLRRGVPNGGNSGFSVD